MQLKPITISEVLLVSIGAGALTVVVVLLAVAGLSIGSPVRQLADFLSDAKSYLLVGATFAISFLSALSWLLMLYWQQRQG